MPVSIQKTQEVHSDSETGEISSDDDTGDEDDKVEQESLIESVRWRYV